MPECKQQALQRGPHKSLYDYGDFIIEEFIEFILKGFWFALPSQFVMHLKKFRLSPLGCIPQHERQPCIIVDYSFYDVNQSTKDNRPDNAMQFGHALPRV